MPFYWITNQITYSCENLTSNLQVMIRFMCDNLNQLGYFKLIEVRKDGMIQFVCNPLEIIHRKNATILGRTKYNRRNNIISDALVEIYPNAINQYPRHACLYARVLAHELGHALCLDHAGRTSVMSSHMVYHKQKLITIDALYLRGLAEANKQHCFDKESVV